MPVRPNLFDPRWQQERTDGPLKGRTVRVGALAGCERLGGTLYEIDPGNCGSPYHLHHGNEELIIVIAGRPSLRGPDGVADLQPGDLVACPVGARGCHQLQNHTDEPVRVLVMSTMVYPEVAELPDSDKVLVLSAAPGVEGRVAAAFPCASAVDRLAGELGDSSAGGGLKRRAPTERRFEPAVGAWVAGLGRARDAVRQGLVARQLAVHLAGRPVPLRVADIGCGQGTQAIALAREGHVVVGIDLSDELLGAARSALNGEPRDVRERVRFEHGDLLDLDARHRGRYDLVCCHGVAMYLPSLADAVEAVVGAARSGGMVSILTRNRAGIAMRAGMRRDWIGALEGFDARHYTNRLGLEAARADEPGEVQAALADVAARTLAWYGVRLFSDHWDAEDPPADFTALLDGEYQAGRRDPYRALAALTHTVAELA